MKQLNKRRLTILVMVLALVLAACGGDDTTDDTEDTSPETTTTTAAPTTTAGGGEDSTTTTTEPMDDGGEDAFAAIEEAAREEGALTIYAATHDSINIPEFEAFNEAYPDIEITHTRLVSGQLTARFSSETESGATSADLVIIADNLMLEDHPEWFVQLHPDNVPNIDGYPDQFNNGHYVNFMAGPFVITWNTELLDAPPETWEDLADPAFAGAGSLASPNASGSFMAVYAHLREFYGDDFLRAVGEQGFPFYDSSATAVQQAAAGETGFVGPGQKAHSAEVRAAGAPLEVHFVTPTLALTHIAAVAANAEHPNAALVYLNWLLTKDGQEAACQGLYNSLAFSDIPDCEQAASDLQIIDPAKGAAEAEDILNLLGLN